MSQPEKQLRECPFCGGDVTMAYTGSSDWEVTCKTCPVETKFWVSAPKFGYGEGENAEAVRRWNTRQPEEELREILIRRMADDLSAPSHVAALPMEHGKNLGDRIDQLERELADMTGQRDYYAAKVNGTPPSSTAAPCSECRRLNNRLAKIDETLDELEAPKAEQVDGLTMELSRVGRILRLVGVRRDAGGSFVKVAAPSAIEPTSRERALEERLRICEDTLMIYSSHNRHGPQAALDALAMLKRAAVDEARKIRRSDGTGEKS